jgi:hypothetical protein
VSDERRLKPQKKAGVSGTKLNSAAQRCAHTLSERKAKVHCSRDYSAAGVSTQSGTPSAVAESGRIPTTTDCGLPQLSEALRRQPQRIA